MRQLTCPNSNCNSALLKKITDPTSPYEWECSLCGTKIHIKPEATQKPGHPEVVTLSGLPRCNDGTDGAPCPIEPSTGMYKDYWVLSEEERKKGFVRPVRRTYKHVGIRPKYPTRELTPEEKERYKDFFYHVFEPYPDNDDLLTGRYWTEKQLSSGCGTVTTMGLALAETYARDPKFYGGTFCCWCRTHFPVEEFVWDGTEERLGS